MRYLVGLVLTLALVTSPLGVSAQDATETVASESEVEGAGLPSNPVGEEGALNPRLRKRTRQKWDPDIYDVRRVPPSHPDKLASKRGLEPRQRAGIGFAVSFVVFGAGVGMATAGFANSICIFEPCSPPRWAAPVGITGALLAVGGIVGMAASGHEMRTAKRQQDSLRAARRVQWDTARSRLVF